MAKIHDLLEKISDPALKEALVSEVAKLSKQKKFGLVFEEHLPEACPMPGVPIRVGMTVATRAQDGGSLFKVKSIEGEKSICIDEKTDTEAELALEELVAVTKFGEPIFPYLEKIDEIENGGGDLWHTLIQADNYHALQLLEYLYPGQVDCIYIDPPYNTGAKDWKYNNDYVDGNDAWRHSKWLSMMEKRLKIAKRLLNPRDSVLIVTIDEKEYLHLGMLLEQMFPEARIQMVTSVINPKGSFKDGQLTRCEEYLYFVQIGDAMIQAGKTDYLFESSKTEVRWPSLKRTGTHSSRQDRPNLFYPLYYSKETGRIVSIGSVLPIGVERSSIKVQDGLVAVWPLDDKGKERIWQLGPETLSEIAKQGYVNFGKLKNGNASPYYVSAGLREQIDQGQIFVHSRDEYGVAELAYAQGSKGVLPRTVWNVTSHSASEHGTKLISAIIGEKKFSFPKSIYAVHDSIRSIVANKPNALILDFFAGSGTTLHAVNLLNAEDGGKRRCILVTNSEVSNDEAAAFRKNGLKPGDAEWEAKGIARYVTWPRTTCSIKGVNVKGEPLKGDYLGPGVTDEGALPGMNTSEKRPLKMSEGFKSNAAFFKLGFLDSTGVSLGRKFKELLPVMWMKAGAHGKCPNESAAEDMLVLPENRMAILFDECYFAAFKKAVKTAKDIETIYVVTDFEPTFKSITKAFPTKSVYALYRNYLDSFRLNAARN